jgi:molecular chaperone GrpE
MEDIKLFLENKNIDYKSTNILANDGEKSTHSLIDIISEYSTIAQKDAELRALADFKNYKKRIEGERENIEKSTKVKLLESLIDVYNDIHLGIDIMPESERAGLTGIMGKLSNFFKSNGIEEIQCSEYDEDLHEVVHVENSDKVDKISIKNVVSRGYTIEGKVFRYPKVILTKPN